MSHDTPARTNGPTPKQLLDSVIGLVPYDMRNAAKANVDAAVAMLTVQSETPAITDRMVDMLADNFWPDDWRDSDVASRIRMECRDALKEVLAPSPLGVEEGAASEERK